jgi:hypothetical protein
VCVFDSSDDMIVLRMQTAQVQLMFFAQQMLL